MSESYEELLRRFLHVLGKEECPETEEKLRHHFGIYPEEQHDPERLQKIYEKYVVFGDMNAEEVEAEIQAYYETVKPQEAHYYSGLMLLAYRAMQDLRWVTEPDNIAYLPEFISNPKKIKSLKAFQKNIRNTLELFMHQDIQEYFKLECEERAAGQFIMSNFEFAPNKKTDHFNGHMSFYEELFCKLNALDIELMSTVNQAKNKKGKPSLSGLHEFVYGVAEFYEELSGEDFKVDKHPDPVEGHSPLTKGMEFVWVAMDWLHAEAQSVLGIGRKFTSENIAHACDIARTKIRESKKNNCAKNNKK